MVDIIIDTLIDSIRLVPFLFLTYLVMELLEHRGGNQTNKIVKKAGKFGPIIGAIAGAVPQCGFSAAAANLYAGRVISLGTLIAIFLSTSDEMLPILISEQINILVILKILGVKIIVGIIAGFLIDFMLRRKKEEHHHIHEMCESEGCQCEKGIFRSTISHTLQITIFIMIFSFVLNILLFTLGEGGLENLIINKPIIGQFIAGLIGLIPNCASSVAITQLYLNGALTFGAMMSGLLVGAGIGILILCRVNKDKKENIKIITLLYIIGVVAGIVLEWIPIL